MNKITDYYAFSDESHHNIGLYRSIALVQIDKDKIEDIENKLFEILNKYGIKIKSFKWNQIRTNNSYLALKNLLDYLLPLLKGGMVKIEVIIWFIEDSRHFVMKRDDTINLSMMYNKIIKDFVKRHLKRDDKLYLYADQTDSINWQELEQILYKQKVVIKKPNGEMESKIFIEECSTDSQPLIQIADIFAGMACTSYKNFDDYKHWAYPEQYGRKSFKNLSDRDKYRFKIYKIINNWNYQRRICISLKDNEGFFTDRLNASSPLNFWCYTPQHEYDKAPKKSRIKNI